MGIFKKDNAEAEPINDLVEYRVYVGNSVHSLWHSRQPARNVKRDLKRYEGLKSRIIRTQRTSEGFEVSVKEVW